MMLGAIAQFLGSPPSKATEPTYRRALLPESHRSTSGVHKLLVLSEDNVALTRLTSAGTVLRILDYNSFRVAFVTDQAMPLLAETDLRRVRVRDDYDLIALNGWSIDTRLGEPSDLPTDRKQSPAQYPWQLYVVQFVGPPRDEWLAELTALDDVQVISYLATNAYLVRATPAAWARVDSEAGRGSGTLQWAGVYHPAYRIAQGLDPAIVDGAVAVDVVVQILDTPEGRMATESIRRDAMAALDDVPPLNGLRNVRVRLLASSLPALAHEPEVTWIEPWLQPRASDERQAQIVANNVTTISNEEQPSGVGYWSWLQGQNLTCPTGASQCTTGYFSGFSVDVSDGGFDLGSTSNVISPDFKTPGGLSRILYARTYVGGSASDSNGHGTLSAATVGGYNINADDESRDATLYQYGLGIAPSVRLGISKMIGSSSFSTVIADAYASEARISNNSWNAAIPDNTYDTTAQTYDLLVRDARSNQGGNQEMTIVFAASNFGPGVSTVTRPATAKNVISVGASEGFRKTLGTVAKPDGCGVDGESDDAKDIASFSSRGPTHDGRKKPDLVAPGTRITGAASRTICDAGPNPPSSCDDVLPDPDCNVSPPPCCPECLLGCGFIRDPLTTTRKHIVVGGTSFAAPAVSGAAALVRQFFRTRSPAAWTPDPSPAMTKAFLTATATYLTGDGANDTLPSNSQGYGRLNLGRAFDATPNRRVDQTTVFDAAGQTYTIATSVADAAKPVRIVLAWTDRYGPTFGNAWVNDLDLEVILEEPGGDVLQFQGNQFAGAKSECVEIIGVPPARTDCVASLIPDVRNNAEAVFMPAGTTGSLTITVRALTIVGDGVPGVGDMTDQDFALFVYNATP